MRNFTKTILAGTALALAVPIATQAIAQIITTNLVFARGQSSATVNGTIRGDQIRDYVVRASAGQVMTVRMSGSPIVYFNVMPPGSNGEGIHTGSDAGNNFSGTLSVSGAYIVRVYQMRATARRGQAGSFRLTVSVTGRRPGAPSGGGNAGSIAGIQGMNPIGAIDELRARGFENVDTLTSGNTLYGIYYYRPTRLCVQTMSAGPTILDIRDIKTHPKCR